MKIIFALIFSFCFTMHTIAQTDTLARDSIAIDTSSISKHRFLSKAYFKEVFGKKNYPNPKVAGVLSLIIPGAGQAYNKKYWKIPFVYAALGGLVYGIDYNRSLYHDFRDTYQARIDKNPNFEDKYPFLDNSTVLSFRNKFDKRRQQVWLGFVAVWLLNSTEAFINAHLLKFDVSDDLSLHVYPTMIQGQSAMGICLSF